MKRITLAVLICTLILITINVCLLFPKKDIAFVDIGKVQDSYLLKKDLEEKAKGKLLVLKNMLDSLSFIKKMEPSGNTYTRLDTNIARIQYEFNKMYAQSNEDISVALWKRLNPLMEAYGKSHRFKMIVGANGAGTIMYGDKDYDITDDLIRFINKDYAPSK